MKQELLNLLDSIPHSEWDFASFSPRYERCGCLAHHYCRTYKLKYSTGYDGINKFIKDTFPKKHHHNLRSIFGVKPYYEDTYDVDSLFDVTKSMVREAIEELL